MIMVRCGRAASPKDSSVKKESASFWKKKQKLLLVEVGGKAPRNAKEQKFFGSFFQKRTASFLKT
jgi:heat shock protein HslJ